MPCSEHLLGGCSELSTKWMPGAKPSRAYWCWQEHREHVLYQWSCTGLGQVLLWYKWFFAQLLSLRQKCRKKNPVALCLIQTGNLLQALLLVPAYWGCCPLLFSSEDKGKTYTAGKSAVLQVLWFILTAWPAYSYPSCWWLYREYFFMPHRHSFGHIFIYKVEQAVTTDSWPCKDPALISDLIIR